MGSITIVNLTNSSLQSAITLADVTYSAANDILPNTYYHHNAAAGTGYKVWERWYSAIYSTDFENTNLGSYLTGALIAVASLAVTIGSIAILPWGEFKSAIDVINENQDLAVIALSTLAAEKENEATAAQVLKKALDLYRDTHRSSADYDRVEQAYQDAQDAHDIAKTALDDAVIAEAAAAALVTDAAIRHDLGEAAEKFVKEVGKWELAGVFFGGLFGAVGIGMAVGTPLADYAARLRGCAVPSVGGGENRILSFTGNVPIEVREQKDAQGNTSMGPQIPSGMTAETAPPPTFAGDLTPQVFDKMRRNGKIYEIKRFNSEDRDVTQGFVRLNLRGGGGKKNVVTHNGITLDISKIYKIFLLNSKDALTPSCLRAGEDGDDDKVYLMHGNEDQQLSCCYWQFIPTREKGVNGQGGWIIVDRRNVRSLCWSDNVMRQYPSEDIGIKIVDGWATNVTRDGMVWNLSSFKTEGQSLQGSIEQPNARMCVTAHTNDGSQIDVIPFDKSNTLQTWVVEAVEDGSDFATGLGLSGYVFLQDTGAVPLVNDQFAGTRNEKRRLEGFTLKFDPSITNLSLEYMAHLEKMGDTNWIKEGELVGTTGQSRSLEGFAIKLTGSEAAKYRVSYMAHIKDFGDTDFFHDGEFCGTRGQSRQVEGIQVHVELR